MIRFPDLPPVAYFQARGVPGRPLLPPAGARRFGRRLRCVSSLRVMWILNRWDRALLRPMSARRWPLLSVRRRGCWPVERTGWVMDPRLRTAVDASVGWYD